MFGQVAVQAFDPCLMAEKTVAAQQDAHAAFACAASARQQPAHGAPDHVVVLAYIGFGSVFMDVREQGNHRHARCADLRQAGVDQRMGEADYREGVALHGQLFDLRDDGGGRAVVDVVELAAQVGGGVMLRCLADGVGQLRIKGLGCAQQQHAETVGGPTFANALADQPCGEIAHRFGGLEHLFGGAGVDRRAGVQHAVDGGYAEPRMGGNGGDGWAFVVVHGRPLERLDRKLSSPAGPG